MTKTSTAQALFTFLQMHFLFVNSTVIVERFGLFARYDQTTCCSLSTNFRFGFMHLVATNLALWVRTVIWESANEWIHHVYSQSIAKVGLGGDVIRVPDTPVAIGNRRSDDLFFRDRSIGDIGNYDYTDAATSQAFSLAGLGQGCNGSLPISPDHIAQVISLYACFNDNTLGRLWTSSMPYLFPFIVEYRYAAHLLYSFYSTCSSRMLYSPFEPRI